MLLVLFAENRARGDRPEDWVPTEDASVDYDDNYDGIGDILPGQNEDIVDIFSAHSYSNEGNQFLVFFHSLFSLLRVTILRGSNYSESSFLLPFRVSPCFRKGCGRISNRSYIKEQMGGYSLVFYLVATIC